MSQIVDELYRQSILLETLPLNNVSSILFKDYLNIKSTALHLDAATSLTPQELNYLHKTRHILRPCVQANQSQHCVLQKTAASIQFKGYYTACDSSSRLSCVMHHAYIAHTLILHLHGALYTFLIM